MTTLSLDQIAAILDRHYGLGRLVSARFLDKGFINTSYEIVTRLEGRERRYFFRLYRSGSSACKVRFEHQLMAELARRGFGLAPLVIPTREGETFLEVKEEGWCRHEGRHLAIFTHLAGQDNHAWDRPDCTSSELASAAETLGRYHTTIYGWQVKRNWPEPPIIEVLPEFGPRWRSLAGQAGRTAFDLHFLAGVERKARLAEALLVELPRALYRVAPRLAIHGDFHPGNLKFDRGRVVGLFDFDWANLDLRVFDLALALNYFCSSWRPAAGGRLILDRAEMFLRRYQTTTARSGRQPGPLSELELVILPHLLQVANLFVLDWIVDDFYQTGPDEELYLGYLLHAFSLSDWLAEQSDRLAAIFQYHRRLFLGYEPRPWAPGLETLPDPVPDRPPLRKGLSPAREGLSGGGKGWGLERIRLGEELSKGRTKARPTRDN